MKKLKWIAGSLVLLLIIIVVIVFMSINGIVRNVVESQATSSLNLQTTLASANVSLLGGSLGLNDLQIVSPTGFSAPRMFMLDGVNVGVSVGNLRGDPIAVDRVVIDKPKLVIEQAGGKFNFQTLMDLQPKQAPESGKPGDGTREQGEPIRLIVRDLSINNATVVLRPGIPGLASEINIPIPSLQLKDIGMGEGNKNGVAIKEVVMVTITSLAQKATESDLIPAEAKQLLSLNVDQVKQRVVAEVNKQVGKITQDLSKQVSDQVGKEAGKAIEQGIGNFLNRGQSTTRPAGTK